MTPLIAGAALLIVILPTLVLLALATRWVRPLGGELPILMYHKVKPTADDPWTVTVDELDRQWQYLKQAGYRAITCAELVDYLNRQGTLPEKSVLITLDDAYQNNLAYAYPLLERHALRASMFLPVKFLGGENEWDGGGERLLGYDELRQMAPGRIEFGLHSYAHGNYRQMSIDEIEVDLRQCIVELQRSGLPFAPVLAYPFGAYPRFGGRARALRRLLERLGIQCALRVGNRINRLPPAKRYALKRLDIRREDTLQTFCRKLDRRRGWFKESAGPTSTARLAAGAPSSLDATRPA